MPSTYSNLKIQLMATGENATTWGDVTNANLGTAIEEAIIGSATVTFASGNVTLTLTDTNGTQTARNMRLFLTGTTGGTTRNLVVPSIEKPYIINNGCADAVVVKTAAGNGITVPSGKTMWVYSNGSDVVDVTTHLTSVTLATPLGVASGGLGNNTGSGAGLVNLNASSITSGTLAVTYGGTGATTNAAARVNLLPSYAGNEGKILALNSGGTDTEWISAGGSGTVLSVNANSTVSGLSFTGGPITSSGTLTLGGTLNVASGGTGATTLTSGAVLIGAGTSAVTSVSPGTASNVLTSNGTAWVSSAFTGGGVTSISFGSTGLTPSTATNGTVSVAGTLSAGNGGTGRSTLTANSLVAGNGTSAVNLIAPGTSGNILASNGTAWVSTGFNGTFALSDGSETTPSLYFADDTNTGIYRALLAGSYYVATTVQGVKTFSTNENQILAHKNLFTQEGLFVTNGLRVSLGTAPASATATGTTGDVIITSTYIYVCTATNTWKRVAIATW